MDILTIVILALAAEAIWETAKMVWQDGKVSVDRIGAIAISILIAIAADVDIFVLIGIPLSIPYLGIVLTGLLASRGANFIHDFYEKVRPAN